MTRDGALIQYEACCPYCGERLELLLDLSAGSRVYTEDCQVCCRPMEIRMDVDMAGNLSALDVSREDD